MNRTYFAGLVVMTGLIVTVSCGSEDGIDSFDTGEITQALTVQRTFRNGENAYSGSVDATMRQASSASNYGAATTCEIDGDDGSGVDKSCVLSWDVSSIPVGSTVLSALLTLRVVDPSSHTYNIHELLRPWHEAAVTWNRATTGVNWQSPGALGAADRGALVGTVARSSNGRVTVALNAQGIARVQSWVNAPATNAGFVISHPTNTNGLDFASSEHATVSYRPQLSITYDDGAGGTGGATAANLLVAFIGDQGANGDSDSVLNLIKNEGAHAVVHNGDFDYADNPTSWNNRITGILGASYPYFAVIGNHDAAAWGGSNGYAAKIAARHALNPEMQCTGELGVKSNCYFRGLHLLVSCVGTSELRSTCAANASDQTAFIQSSLSADNSVWSICNWHKNQHDMQVGTKGNEVGWTAYQHCMNAGSMVMTGHEHSYARTKALTDVGNAANGHGQIGSFDDILLGPGRNFVAVSGLAGVGIRSFSSSQHNDDTWWASYYTSDRWVKSGVLRSGVGNYGALFIRFHVDGDPKKARAYFKDVSGRIVDDFTIATP